MIIQITTQITRVILVGVGSIGAFTDVSAQAILDQQQIFYDGGISALTDPGYSEWQSFRAGVTGELSLIEAGFFNDISGDGFLQIYVGEGTQGSLLQSVSVPVVSTTQSSVSWNSWSVSAPVLAGLQYTFNFVPNEATMPNPYGIAIGTGDRYLEGTHGQDYPDYSNTDNFDLVFRTYVTPVPEPSTYALLLLSGAASLWALKRRKS
jgi:hypothetical protein